MAEQASYSPEYSSLDTKQNPLFLIPRSLRVVIPANYDRIPCSAIAAAITKEQDTFESFEAMGLDLIDKDGKSWNIIQADSDVNFRSPLQFTQILQIVIGSLTLEELRAIKGAVDNGRPVYLLHKNQTEIQARQGRYSRTYAEISKPEETNILSGDYEVAVCRQQYFVNDTPFSPQGKEGVVIKVELVTGRKINHN